MDEAFAPRLAPTVVPTLAAAQARIAAARPAAHARTRNALDGAVSQLSPYITHGFVTLAEVLAGVAKRHALDVQHKFVYELGWRIPCLRFRNPRAWSCWMRYSAARSCFRYCACWRIANRSVQGSLFWGTQLLICSGRVPSRFWCNSG